MKGKPNAFPRRLRLTDPGSYARVFNSRNRLVLGPVQVVAAANGRDTARLGIAVSRRATRTAVLRNRLKRLIREIFRRYRSELTGLDLIVSVNRNSPALTSPAFGDNVETLFKRLTACVPH